MNKWEQTSQNAWEAILERVRELKKDGQTLQQIADLVGAKNRSLIGEWLNGNRGAANTSFPNMMNYLERLGLDYLSFFPSEELRVYIKRPGLYAPTEEISGDGLPKVPVMGLTGAGDAVELFDATPDRWIPVLPTYYQKELIGLVVYGTSMEPTIRKGAIVGIVPYDGSLNDGGIYLIHRPPFGRTIKRVRMGSEGQILLHSDNPEFPPVNLPFEGYEQIIIGQVKWIWQSVD